MSVNPLPQGLSPELLSTAAGRRAAADHYRALLLDDCLPFWFPRSLDLQHGGFLHCLDRDGTLVDSDKSVWAQGRMSWMLQALAATPQLQSDPRCADWRRWAESGLNFLRRHCFDEPAGQMYFHVTRDGRPIRRRRYVYSEAFACIAFAAHAEWSQSEESSHIAWDLFRTFTRVNFTPGAMPPKFTETRPLVGLAPRMITLVTAQEMRRRLGPHPLLHEWIDRCIHEIETLFWRPDLDCVLETVQPDGQISDHFDGRLLNPGHAIEGAWFILEEGRFRGDDRLIQLGCQMLDCMWQRGWDSQFGGLFYFRDVFDKPVQEYWHEMKFWWPHDEALIATLLAWRLTGQQRFLQRHCDVFNWASEKFADPEHGEWFGWLHRDGTRSSTLKGNLWKSFFHHPRALWMCWLLLDEQTVGKTS
ncbi:MAG: AGE family epimerase/isomerase [Planctomycetaceae bacterium]|jgi:N-acylglucosamine 2-epimerase